MSLLSGFFASGCLLFLVSSGFSQNKVNILTVPAGDKFTEINVGSTSILPSGRFVKPAGQYVRIPNGPYGLAISPDGKKSVTLHNGVITIIDVQSLANVRVPSYDQKIKSPLKLAHSWGLLFRRIQKRFISVVATMVQ